MLPRGPAPDHATCLEFALYDRVEPCGRHKDATQVGRCDRRVDLTKPRAVDAPNLAAPGIMEDHFVAERDDEPIPHEIYPMGLKARKMNPGAGQIFVGKFIFIERREGY